MRRVTEGSLGRPLAGLVLCLVVGFVGGVACDDRLDDIRVYRAETANEVPTGWEIDSQGTFRAGYNGNIREILYITSPDGRRFLAITGCGVTELREERNGNHYVTEED